MKEPWDQVHGDPLAALRDGDPGPFERFVEVETSTLLGFFRRLGASREEAEDLTQDTIVKLYRSAPRYEARERFEALAYRVARNAWIDAGRRASVRPARAAGGDGALEAGLPRVASEPDVERLAESRESGERLEAAMARLSQAQREVFELGALQELPYEQVAAILSIPVGTVKSRMFNAVRKLRELLETSDSGGAES